MKLPRDICTVALYPNIHPDHVGRPMPEVLGNCSLLAADSDAPGAVEAIYVDKTSYEYLAAAGPLLAIDQVYSDGTLKTLNTHYTIHYKDGGRTYIKFNANQKTKKITYNARGYFCDLWDSALVSGEEGYIRNPIYIILYTLVYIVGVREEDINMDSFDDLAADFILDGYETAGKLILQDQEDVATVLQKLLWSFGVKMWVANDGRLTIGKKTAANYDSDVFVFRQIDCLSEPKRTVNYNNAINYVQYQYDYTPHANAFKGAGTDSRATSISGLGEQKAEWEFPWATDADLVAARVTEELDKRENGRPMIEMDLAIEWLDTLDIMDSFRFQDPYGRVSGTESGEYGWYFSVTGIDVDHEGHKIKVTAEDLAYLV